jgi:hypothetical protein
MRVIILAFVAAALGGCVPSLASLGQGPALQAAAPGEAVSSSRPIGASPNECYYDEGYGRYTSCSAEH